MRNTGVRTPLRRRCAEGRKESLFDTDKTLSLGAERSTVTICEAKLKKNAGATRSGDGTVQPGLPGD